MARETQQWMVHKSPKDHYKSCGLSYSHTSNRVDAAHQWKQQCLALDTSTLGWWMSCNNDHVTEDSWRKRVALLVARVFRKQKKWQLCRDHIARLAWENEKSRLLFWGLYLRNTIIGLPSTQGGRTTERRGCGRKWKMDREMSEGGVSVQPSLPVRKNPFIIFTSWCHGLLWLQPGVWQRWHRGLMRCRQGWIAGV